MTRRRTAEGTGEEGFPGARPLWPSTSIAREGAHPTPTSASSNRAIKGSLGLVEARRMSTEPIADCKRCGRAVREDHSHVMVVPVGHTRMYFHAGCEPPIRDKRDFAEDKIASAHEA